jgi:hypothetical protein
MDQNFSRAANNFSDSQDILLIFRYSTGCNILPCVPILIQKNAVHSLPHYFNIILPPTPTYFKKSISFMFSDQNFLKILMKNRFTLTFHYSDVASTFFFQWLFQPIRGPGLLFSSVITFHRWWDSSDE